MARRFVGQLCDEWGLGELCDPATLLTSELVTNGVIHARTTIGVRVAVSKDAVCISVNDQDRRLPVPREVRADLLADIDTVLARGSDESDERHAVMQVGPAGSIAAGRGLLLVEALADAWGVERQSDGKTVWFRLHAPEHWPSYGSCVCP
jgi:anti-sigma regulatory factor (Ser/Thr protein kinase)